jgi:short-subunit dehydrogenase
MPDTALITGASSGIGRELARIHAEQQGDLVLVARRLPELEVLKSELESKHGVSVTVLSVDLSVPGAAQTIFDQVQAAGLEISYLINNAGFGGHGFFHQRSWALDQAMIQVNVMALAELTRLFLPEMVRRQSGKILNVASTAGMLPGPLQAVYYASKAFVLSFSQALAEELAETRVSVTALCPGPVATGFAQRANLQDVEAFEQAASARTVAEIGYRAMMQGKLVVIDDWKLSFLLNWVAPWLPRKLVLRLSRQSMEKRA